MLARKIGDDAEFSWAAKSAIAWHPHGMGSVCFYGVAVTLELGGISRLLPGVEKVGADGAEEEPGETDKYIDRPSSTVMWVLRGPYDGAVRGFCG